MQNNTFSGFNLRQNLIVLEEVTSTNDYLKGLFSNIKPLAEGTAIMAKHQTNGKGQRGNNWLTKPGENLTVSFLLYPEQLDIRDGFNLNIVISLGVQKWLKHYIKEVYIKWPNDIYIGQKKIGGILIENQLAHTQIKSTVVGIGININQKEFKEPLNARATSLKATLNSNRMFDIRECCVEMLEEIFTLYKQTELTKIENLKTSYTNSLFRIGKLSLFEIHGNQVEGVIQGIDQTGLLMVLIDKRIQSFDLKEIRYIF